MIKFTIRSNRRAEYVHSDDESIYHIEPLYLLELSDNGDLNGYIDNVSVIFIERSRYNNLLVENRTSNVIKESFSIYPDAGREFYRMDVNIRSLDSEIIKMKLFESKEKHSDQKFQEIIDRVIYPGYKIECGITGMKFDSESALKIFGYDWKLLQLQLEYPERISDNERLELCKEFIRKYLI